MPRFSQRLLFAFVLASVIRPAFGQAAVQQSVSDVFVGRNAVGPYLLSWRGIEPKSESISVGISRLGRDADYTLDPATGTLTFRRPLRTGEIARVDYQVDARNARQTAALPAAPLEFKLFNAGSAGLSMNALWKPAAASTNPTQSPLGLMLLGFGGAASVGGQDKLTSRLFLDARGGNILDRSGLQLEEKLKTAFGQFSAGFTRGGKSFAAGEETGIATGKQILEAAGSLAPIYGFTASASYRQIDELPADGQGASVAVLSQKIAGSIGPTRIQASRSTTDTQLPDGTSSQRVADRLQIDRKLNKKTQATALIERNESLSGDSKTVAQTNGLTIRSEPSDNVSIQGSFINRLLPSGAEDTTNLKVEAAPFKQLKLAATLGDRFNAKSALHSREANLEYSPLAAFSITSSVRVRAEGMNQLVAGGFGAVARPFRFLEFAGGFRLRDAMKDGVVDPTVPNSYDAKVSLKVLRSALRLTGAVSSNPEDEKGVIARAINRQIGLESTLGAINLAGGYAVQEDYLTAKTNTVLDLRFGWQFARLSQLITSFKQSLAIDSALLATDTYSLSLTHKVGSLFDLALSGVMTTYERDGVLQPIKDYKAEARLGLRF